MDHHWTGGPPDFGHHLFPLLGVPMFFLTLLLLTGLFFWLRRGQFGPPPWVGHRSPEGEAKKILAERFARGDIGSDEFMERASILNWTPGSESLDHVRRGKKRR